MKKTFLTLGNIETHRNYDGSAAVPLDVTGLPKILEAPINAGLSQKEIQDVAVKNLKRLFLET